MLGCKHYQRGCKFVSPCCGDIFWCRHCHNEEKYDNVLDPKIAHKLERKDIQEIICGNCDKKQPVSNQCIECSLIFGKYFCEVCRLYDNEDKGQFHCDGCGICRQGGKENFFHCDKCVACLPLSIKDSHKCLDESLKVNCPVCLEYLMESTEPASILNCGHPIHSSCQKELIKSGITKCPTCNTSMFDMESQWNQIDQLIAETTMPEEYQDWHVKILCSDCHQESMTNFHIIGMKCQSCGGYNTRRIGNETPPSSIPPSQSSE